MFTKRLPLLLASLLAFFTLLGTVPLSAQAPIKKHEAVTKSSTTKTKTTKTTTTKKKQTKNSSSSKPSKSTSLPTSVKTLSDGSISVTVRGVNFKMVKVNGGEFLMGAAADDNDAFTDEEPRHQVTLYTYYIGQTEVTQALWEAVMGSNPSLFIDGSHPVEQVTWHDCQKFIRKLIELTGQDFRLPTEAEWEFAARGGNKSNRYKYSGSNYIDAVAWYLSNSSSETHEVATKQANELGIYDMTGNVWEWCSDWKGNYSSNSQWNPVGPNNGSEHVVRGGSLGNVAKNSRVSSRYYYAPTSKSYDLGLRLAIRTVR